METPLGYQSERLIPGFATPLLFTLPAEIRLDIFGYCIPRKCAIKVTNAMYRPYGVEPLVSTRDPSPTSDRFANTQPLWTNILHVSKRMSDECLDILYGQNLFEVYLNKGGEATIKKTFSKENLQRIRFILAISPGPCFTGELNPPDISFWAMMIPNLKLFEWVAQPDNGAEQNMGDFMIKQGLEGWMEWTDAYSDCFAEFLVTGVEFKMRFDKGDGEHRKIGRLFFRRGPFFLKNGQK
ncbi:uncharacterized protein N7500_005876 [Penicillium coprophilum]|uniref:uncharacterized protein n=1 Tax=Penicillium coprophilum TaxID=36646 RepID=UPI002396F268|nr:uncharacterized protein N7500_005876 [Penicillium coprophilum]KAJ5164046.1 hypothetical protein N7500_005876 [Penicillium coprophilum]